ncbi:MAG: hypothetical protein Q9226_005205, partial [Calogaya cf. arnoldii]
SQLEESLSVFESITKLPYLQNATFFVLLNKADLFAQTIHHRPISDFCPDYTGGVDYEKACGYMTDCYRRRNGRPPGKLHLLLVDSLDTAVFQNAWRQVQEQIIHTTLKY